MENYTTINQAIYGMLDSAEGIVKAYRNDLCIDAGAIASMKDGETAYQVLRENGSNWYEETDFVRAQYNIQKYWKNWYVLVKWTKESTTWTQELLSMSEDVANAGYHF